MRCFLSDWNPFISSQFLDAYLRNCFEQTDLLADADVAAVLTSKFVSCGMDTRLSAPGILEDA